MSNIVEYVDPTPAVKLWMFSVDFSVMVIFHSVGATFMMLAPLALFLQILRRLPDQLMDIKCHTTIAAVNALIYISIRVTFGYLNDQTFGWVPFGYVFSLIQVCLEDAPNAIQMEEDSVAKHVASLTSVSMQDVDVSESFQIKYCTTAPGLLWVAIAAVNVWEILMAVHIYSVRKTIEKTMLTIVYTDYRAIVLYFRFVDAMWRLLLGVCVGLVIPMALSNRQLFRWQVRWAILRVC